jgi:hypothetical protein
MRKRVVLALVLAVVLLLGVVGYALAAEFTDVKGTPYEGAITQMTSRGFAGGYADNTFRPDNTLQRQQFAKMAVLMLGYPVSAADVSTFKDTPAPYDPVNNPLYPGAYVAVAAANHIINGYANGSFGFTDNVTRQQVISIAVRAARDVLEGVAVPDGWKGVLDYSDPNHGTNVMLAEYAGLLSGIKDLATWDLKANATRGEACEILAQVYYRSGAKILKISGPTGTKEFTLAQLKAMTATEGYGATKTKTGTITAATKYKGVAIKDLMAQVGGTAVDSIASDGYKMSYTADEVNGVLNMFDLTTGEQLTTITGPLTMIIAYEVNGEALSSSDGPLRIAFVTPTAEQATMSSKWARQVVELQFK